MERHRKESWRVAETNASPRDNTDTKLMDRQKDRQRDGQIDRQTDRQTDRRISLLFLCLIREFFDSNQGGGKKYQFLSLVVYALD